MFSTLKNTLEPSWQKKIENRKINFTTEMGKYKYEVFSTYIIKPEDYYIKTEFKSDNEYQNFLNTIKERSNYNYGIDVGINDTILTLSSCNTNGSKRYVLHAKMLSE